MPYTRPIRRFYLTPPTFATFGAGICVGTSWRGRLLRSIDAIDWKDVHKCEQPIEAVAFGATVQ